MGKDVKKHVSTKNLIKVVTLILIVMFFIPLFTVSCEGHTFEFSAARLTTGYSFQGEELVESYIICSILLILPIVIFIACFTIKNIKFLNLISGIGGLINIVLLVTIIAKAKSKAEENFMQVETNFGFYFSFILNLALIVIAICVQMGITNRIPLLREANDSKIIPRICSKCGTSLKVNYDFCGECGTKYEENFSNNSKFCSNCGKEIGYEDSFCTSCGIKAD